MEWLEKTGVTVREAGPDDAVGGVRPSVVALPESVEEISAVLRACAEHNLAVVPVGGGTKLHWGRPPERCDVLLDLCCLNEVIEHAAGDLVVKAQAGVTMDALADALAEQGQELALDVPFTEGATVGGTLAAATAGPRAFRYGTARDLLIGITVVLPDGTVAKSGGRVVKNVAGYDLGKLFTGSYGTLGVIAEATFRLHPLPVDRRYVVAELDSQPLEHVQKAAAMLAASQAEPSAVEFDWPGGDTPITLAVLVEGSAAGQRAEALRDALRQDLGEALGAGAVTDEAPAWWGLITDDEVLLELRFPPARAGEVLEAVRGTGFALRGSPVAGRVRLEPGSELAGAMTASGDTDVVATEGGTGVVAAESDTRTGFAGVVTSLRERLAPLGGRVTVLAAPDESVDRWGPVSALPLMRRVKERFDPGRVMSPGRFVGGI